MRNRWKRVLGLCVIGMGFGVSAPAQAATANGPYYATPSWDQKLDASIRFIVLSNWNDNAVLDRETGLVWEKGSVNYFDALDASRHCIVQNTGGRGGWRLPTVQELRSLLFGLPSGHPFFLVPGFYWSASTPADNPNVMHAVPSDGVGVTVADKSLANSVLCVRGGQGVEPQ